MSCVLEHVARTRPKAAVVVTDGYIEPIARAQVAAAGRHAPARHRHARRQCHAAATRGPALHPTLKGAVMIRMSEVVLPGHPDKFCDQVADAIVAECYAADPRAYCQVEMSAWCDQVFLTGGIVTRQPLGARPGRHRARRRQAHRLCRAQRHRRGPLRGARHRLPAARGSADVDGPRQRPVHRHWLGRLRREGGMAAARALPRARLGRALARSCRAAG